MVKSWKSIATERPTAALVAAGIILTVLAVSMACSLPGAGCFPAYAGIKHSFIRSSSIILTDNKGQGELGARQRPQRPPSLASLLILITFHWDVARLGYMEAVLQRVTHYPTDIEVVVVTNQQAGLHNVAVERHWDPRIHVWQQLPPLQHPYDLAFVHRDIIKDKVARDPERFSCVMYLEDDIIVSWESLVAWAADNEILAPLEFQRGFQRVEFAAWDGTYMMLDMEVPFHFDPNRTVAVNTTAGVRHFVNMLNPYFGMWIADMKLLQRFMDSPLWNQTAGPWNTREMAACGIQFVYEKPSPFQGSAVVPYDPVTLRLDKIAAIRHVSNNYCLKENKPENGFCSIAWDDALKG